MSALQLIKLSIDSKERTVVKDIDVTFRSGELTMLIGANGSGKSTLINGIFGHPKYSISSGQILIDGEDITQFVTEEKAKKGLFLSMQHLPSIEGVTLVHFLHRVACEVYGNTDMPMEFHDKIAHVVEEFGLDKRLLLREVHTGLSGGEKKQAELLQLIALRPKFAFLDEIDAGMDLDLQKKLQQILSRLCHEGMSIILVSHHLHMLSLLAPTHVYLMQDGRIREGGGTALIDRIVAHGFAGIAA